MVWGLLTSASGCSSLCSPWHFLWFPNRSSVAFLMAEKSYPRPSRVIYLLPGFLLWGQPHFSWLTPCQGAPVFTQSRSPGYPLRAAPPLPCLSELLFISRCWFPPGSRSCLIPILVAGSGVLSALNWLPCFISLHFTLLTPECTLSFWPLIVFLKRSQKAHLYL